MRERRQSGRVGPETPPDLASDEEVPVSIARTATQAREPRALRLAKGAFHGVSETKTIDDRAFNGRRGASRSAAHRSIHRVCHLRLFSKEVRI
jgi:hypothetical protein